MRRALRRTRDGASLDVSEAAEETISRMAGSPHGSYKTISDIEAMVAPTRRPVRQRTTTYGEVPVERRFAALASDCVCAGVRRRPARAGMNDVGHA